MRKTHMFMMTFLCFLMIPVFSHAEEKKEYISGQYEYVLLDDGTAQITRYNGSAERVEIPDVLDGHQVTSLEGIVFMDCYINLKSVTLPDSISYIDCNPFYLCSAEVKVSQNHPYLAVADDILYSKPDKKIIYCWTSEEILEIPDGIIGIADNNTFDGCANLTRVILPESMSEIECNPFKWKNIEIKVSPDHPCFAVIDGIMYNKLEKKIVYCPVSIEEVEIPEGIRAVGDNAFDACDNLKSIVLPDGTKSIGDFAFANCDNLENVVFPDGLTHIGKNVFYNSAHIINVNIPDSITRINDDMFSCCESLTYITLPEGLTCIGKYAFNCCRSLTYITLPERLTSIEEGAFRCCDNLKEMVLPDSITDIGKDAFSDCDNLNIIVSRNSYAADYCKENNLNYTYPDANDWLNE